ncbi:heavy-metal-associated domain-containing protein [Phascolarctobacterium sp.]|uniref:heavy-metal-associated domain-containing protein n=1 Tax=Phascolarctobacterium sp. TaxID=2049039 RepID=UPI003868E424
MVKTIAIEGMHCQHCVQAVNEALAAVAGVTSVAVSLEQNNAVVNGENLDDAALKEAVEDMGFDVTAIA